MNKTGNGNKQTITLISLILAGETIFFLPFVLARIFRPTLLVVFDITNTELGTYFSTYGVVAMVSYIFGGTLADSFPARNLMSIALWLTSLGGVLMAWLPSTRIMIWLYGFWGFTTIFLFWAALIRATREWGGTRFQGRAFGWLEGGRGLIAALLGTLALILFSELLPTSNTIEDSTQGWHAFQFVILAVAVATFLSGLLIWVFVPKKTITNNITSKKATIKKVGKLTKMPTIWMLSIIIVCAYTGYKITDDFSLYAKEVLGFNEVSAAGVGTIALWMRAIVAIVAGYLADHFNRVNAIIVCFGFSILGGLMVAIGFLQQITILVFFQLGFTMIGIYGVRGLYFAVMKEANVPFKYTGTAVGIVSVMGFTPDIFMSPWMGHLLDNHPGSKGHQYVFLVLTLFAALGLIISLLFKYKKGNLGIDE